MPKKATKSPTYPFSFAVAFICISEALIWSLCFPCVPQAACVAYFTGSVHRFSSLETPHPDLLDQVSVPQLEAFDRLPFFQAASYLFNGLENKRNFKLDFTSASLLLRRVKQLTTKAFIPTPGGSKKRKNDEF